MFITHYNDISECLQVGELNQLFNNLDINDLLKKDTLAYDATIKTEPCGRFYEIKVEKDLVTLSVGTNSNKDYESKNISEGEVSENSSEVCEHVLWWKFMFNGKRLHLKEVSGAG